MRVFFTARAAVVLLAILLCPVVLVSSVFICAAAQANLKKNKPSLGRFDNTVIIDPGHGQPDGGAVGTDGVIEKDINLSLSLKLRAFFLSAGFQVIMTRQDDNAIYDKGSKSIRQKKVSDLRNRLAIVNAHPNSLFISIHQNISGSSSSSGSLVLYSPKNDDSKALAQSILTSIRAHLQPQNENVTSAAKKNLYILYHAKSTAVLVECGFLSNPGECKLLQDDTYQNQMAFSIFCGTLNFYESAAQ